MPAGVQLVSVVWQDLTQMEGRYGDWAHTILNSHRATMLLPGIKDPATFEHASPPVGDADTPGPPGTHTDNAPSLRASNAAASAPTTPYALRPTARPWSSTARSHQCECGCVPDMQITHWPPEPDRRARRRVHGSLWFPGWTEHRLLRRSLHPVIPGQGALRRSGRRWGGRDRSGRGDRGPRLRTCRRL